MVTAAVGGWRRQLSSLVDDSWEPNIFSRGDHMLHPRLGEVTRSTVGSIRRSFLFSPLAVLQPAGSVFIAQARGAAGLIRKALPLVHCQRVFHDTTSVHPTVSRFLDEFNIVWVL